AGGGGGRGEPARHRSGRLRHLFLLAPLPRLGPGRTTCPGGPPRHTHVVDHHLRRARGPDRGTAEHSFHVRSDRPDHLAGGNTRPTTVDGHRHRHDRTHPLR